MDNNGIVPTEGWTVEIEKPKTDHAEILEKLKSLDEKLNMLLVVAQTYIESDVYMKQVFNGMRTDKGCGGLCGGCDENHGEG